MEADPQLFLDLTYIFVAALAGGLLAWRLRLPLIIGFIAGGIVISPFTPGPHVSQVHTFETLAETGVVLLMFSIGVEFSIPDLLRVKWVALIGGPLGIAMSIGLSVGLAKLIGGNVTDGVVIGAAISVASTMVLARLLSDRNAMGSAYGRVMIGITLVEDVAVVCMTVVLPIFATSGEGRLMRVVWTLGKAAILLVPLTFFALKIIPRLLRRANRTNDSEILLLAGIAICMGTAALAHAAGFSVAMGAFLAGVAISGSEDLHHAHEQLVPLRDAFVALFFVSLGTLIQPQILMNSLGLLGVMLGLIVFGKFVVWFVVVKLFGYPTKIAIATAAGLTQIGELSFVVVQVAHSAGMVDEKVFIATLAASLISILLNVFIVRAAFSYLSIDSVEPPAATPAGNP